MIALYNFYRLFSCSLFGFILCLPTIQATNCPKSNPTILSRYVVKEGTLPGQKYVMVVKGRSKNGYLTEVTSERQWGGEIVEKQWGDIPISECFPHIHSTKDLVYSSGFKLSHKDETSSLHLKMWLFNLNSISDAGTYSHSVDNTFCNSCNLEIINREQEFYNTTQALSYRNHICLCLNCVNEFIKKESGYIEKQKKALTNKFREFANAEEGIIDMILEFANFANGKYPHYKTATNYYIAKRISLCLEWEKDTEVIPKSLELKANDTIANDGTNASIVDDFLEEANNPKKESGGDIISLIFFCVCFFPILVFFYKQKNPGKRRQKKLRKNIRRRQKNNNLLVSVKKISATNRILGALEDCLKIKASQPQKVSGKVKRFQK